MNPIRPSFGRNTWGFTLIELLAAMAIAAVLAALAYPSYRQAVQRSQRAQARAALHEASLYMERFRAANHRYDLHLGRVPGDAAGPVALPVSLRQVPMEGKAHHHLVLTYVDAGSYRLEAQPLRGDDSCGILAVDQAGRLHASGPGTAAECWR
ncbi:MAG: prepilin-type N-terminal cleavage/methylation domain-containing protein [Burkholderiaceae bacterium]|nr:prepilin-type N-terminal cleavage/methylation domain-containing protein [Burkholderiaceae bacterium]